MTPSGKLKWVIQAGGAGDDQGFDLMSENPRVGVSIPPPTNEPDNIGRSPPAKATWFLCLE